MPGDGEIRFGKLKTHVWNYADRLAQSAADGRLPVPLQKVAGEANIKKLRFEPLLSSAGLEDQGSGFVLWVNTEARQVNESAGRILNLADDGWSKLRPAVRFSIAHEIVHALMIIVSRAEKFTLGGRIFLLEEACNEIARVILLPRELLISSFPNGVLDLDRVAEVIEEAQISPEVFIRRIRLNDVRKVHELQSGVLAFVREESDGLTVVEFERWGAHARHRFGDPESPELSGSKRAALLEHWTIEHRVGKGPWEGDRYSKPVDIRDARGAGLPCELTTLRIHASGFLLSIRILGPLKQTSEALF